MRHMAPHLRSRGGPQTSPPPARTWRRVISLVRIGEYFVPSEYFSVPVPVTVPSAHSGFSHGCSCVAPWRRVFCRACNRMVVMASCGLLYRGVSHSIFTQPASQASCRGFKSHRPLQLVSCTWVSAPLLLRKLPFNERTHKRSARSCPVA